LAGLRTGHGRVTIGFGATVVTKRPPVAAYQLRYASSAGVNAIFMSTLEAE
jgi:hypothetical protein